jgi:AMMECR1 domain-containing protein
MGPSPSLDTTLSTHERGLLLDIADAAIVDGLLRGPPSAPPATGLPAALGAHAGVFVTLTVGEQLNGCIGSIEGVELLGHGVARPPGRPPSSAS